MTLVAGRYEQLKKIGEGGMQEVFLARDHLLDRHVALKRAKNSSAERRFKRSAVLSARVNHQNVAKTLDYVDHDDQAYLVEEFIDGIDLSELIYNELTTIDPSLAARIMHHTARGVAASHAQNVIHRDLKPSNVMSSGGLLMECVKVTDFGIAKMAEEEIIDAVEGGSATLTTSKTVVGALPYMAPEAIETPREITFKADVWSLGAMGYELLYGQPPFGIGLAAVKKITSGLAPSFEGGPAISAQFLAANRELQALVRSCLRPDPADRPTSAELAQRCSELCYPSEARFTGTVNSFQFGAWGFITEDKGPSVFYHLESVYGPPPAVGDRVFYSKYKGGGSWRAFPVIKLRPNMK